MSVKYPLWMNKNIFPNPWVKNLSAVTRLSTEFSTFSTLANGVWMFKHTIQQSVEIEQAFRSVFVPILRCLSPQTTIYSQICKTRHSAAASRNGCYGCWKGLYFGDNSVKTTVFFSTLNINIKLLFQRGEVFQKMIYLQKKIFLKKYFH